jgi:gas vesicle protein
MSTAVASVAGYLAGILTAPQSGRKTRADIRETAISTRVEGERQLKKIHTELDNLIKQTKENSAKLNKTAKTELDEAIKAAKQTKAKAREILSALHEGEAEDKDLQRAIRDAKKAVTHIKKYLQA